MNRDFRGHGMLLAHTSPAGSSRAVGSSEEIRVPVASAGGKPRVAILIPQTWSVRNVVTSGLASHLERNGVEVTLLMRRTDGWERVAPSGSNIKVRELLTPMMKRRIRGRAFIGGILGTAFEHRNRTRENKMAMRRFRGQKSVSPGLRGILIPLLGVLVRPAIFRKPLARLRLAMYAGENDLTPIYNQIREIRPDVIYSTMSIANLEFPYILAAQHLDIPTVSSILSFDNLTSRAELPLFRYYTVWNARMHDDLLRIYPDVSSDRVFVTGTPQFDFHKRVEFCWSRRETLQRLGLPENARYMLYAGNSKHWTPTEPDLIARIADGLTLRENTRDLWIVVRLHPLDDFSRWDELAGSGRKVVISMPWFTKPDANWWAMVGSDDQRLLVSTIAHSQLCANMCSTMALDAAILDRPVIGVAFASVPGSPEEGIYRQTYHLHHYKPLVESRGLRIAHDLDEMMDLVAAALDNPERDQEYRAEMVRRECGVVDGCAAERIAAVISRIVAGEFRQRFAAQS